MGNLRAECLPAILLAFATRPFFSLGTICKIAAAADLTCICNAAYTICFSLIKRDKVVAPCIRVASMQASDQRHA